MIQRITQALFQWVGRWSGFKPILCPTRRRHLLWRVVETCVGLLTGILVWELTALVSVALVVGVSIEFLLYEYWIEPWSKYRVKQGKPSLAGPYWERGPQDGEKFVIE